MVILHCIPSMGGGGAERQLTYLAGGLKSLNHDVHVAYIYEGVNSERLKECGITLHKMQATSNYDPRILFQLVNIISSVKADIVQSWIPQMDVIGSIAAHLTNTAHVLSERISGDVYRGGIKDTIRLFAGRRASAVVANSAAGAKYWTGNGVPCERVSMIRNALPFDEIDAVQPIERNRYNVKEKDRLILYAGRYASQKNVHNLIAALIKVLQRVGNCTVLMFGSGPKKDALMATVSGQGLADRLRVLDYNNQIWSVMKIADAFVSVSHSEGVPNTVIEAIACDCPVVLSKIPPHLELFDDECACYVDKDDPGLMAEKIIQTLKDREHSRHRTRAAHEVIRGWTIEHTAAQYAQLYEEMRR